MTFGIGVLSDQNGAPIPDGALFQIIASADTVFDAPTPTSFFGGNDILVFSGAFDSSSGFGLGTAFLSFTDVPLATYPIAQSNLIIRWFPTLSAQSAAPGFATFYGEYGFTQDSSWVAPAPGSSLMYEFVTVAAGGTIADAVGRATLQTAIPEPSTYAAIFGALALGFVAYRRRLANAA